jgi:biotin carboxylase
MLLLAPARSYRTADFMLAATTMGLDLTVASDGALPAGDRPVIPVRPGDPDHAAERIISRCGPVDAVVAADTPMLLLAAAVASRLGLPHNPAAAVLAAAGKTRQRRLWAAAGVPQPRFEIIPAHARGDAIRQAAAATGLPCVIKAVSLSASQGVLRADDATQAVQAALRIRRGLSDRRPERDRAAAGRGVHARPRAEHRRTAQRRHPDPLAIFDKPATPQGPTFEETLLVTPSRLPRHVVADAVRTAGRAARALGLRTGPVHAELRVTGTGPAMLELAARSIGGLCSRALRFPGGKSLEELILANALGEPPPSRSQPIARPSGVFMLPVPRAGVLRAVQGRADAEAVPGITGVTITIPRGRRVRPLPDGDQYLGFVFAEAATPDEVEKALTTASQRLHAIIE